jgi:hypothetical protein
VDHPIRFFFVLLAAAASAAPATAAVFGVGPPGSPGGCTHTDVQAAIDAAAANPGPDEIRLVRNSTPGYTEQALVIDGQDLTLIGGLPDCAATIPNGRTWLSGAGGVAAPVITIRSDTNTPLQVRLEGLGLEGGDNEGPSPGGGLAIRARGEFELAHSDILGNSAPIGAGIGIFGAEGDGATRVTLGDSVTIAGNVYSGELPSIGGGISVHGADLSLCGNDTSLQWNRAFNGGGIWVAGLTAQWPARLNLCAANLPSRPVLENNSATRGGGLQVQSHATVRIYTRDAEKPLRIARNRADYGGAIDAAGPTAKVDLWDVHVAGNTGVLEGGAFTLFDGAQIGVSPATNPDAPPDAAVCADHRCNTLADNWTDPAQGLGGTIAALATLPTTAPPQLHIDNALITRNVGTRLFSAIQLEPGVIAPAQISLRNSVIGANPQAASWVTVNDGSQFLCDLCTVAYNGPESTSGGALIVSNGPVRLRRSIIWEPGRDLFTGTAGNLSAQSLLVHNDADLAGQSDIRVGDPRFVDDTGDFHLRPDSPALDSAAADDTPATDLDGNPRVRDLLDVPNRLGVVDLGAYERLDNDVLFRDGFE